MNRSTRVGIGNSYNSNRLRSANVRNVDRNNIYNRPENRARNADRAQAAGQLKNARPATGKANNVFADRDGNIARKTPQGWEARGQQGWEKPEAADVRQKADSKDLESRPCASGGVVAGNERVQIPGPHMEKATGLSPCGLYGCGGGI